MARMTRYTPASEWSVQTGGRSGHVVDYGPACRHKYLVTEMVCWATGGPQKYTGRSMADSHAN